MARILYLDLVAGIAGDMFVAALLDLGVPLDSLQAGLDGLGFGPINLSAERVRRGAFAATYFQVGGVEPLPLAGSAGHDHGAHTHEHGTHHHGDHAHGDHHEHSRHTRSHAHIRRHLESAPLPERARQRALAVFQCLATAEARVHGVSEADVHFHEVGAVDSIADIVGVCLALEWLGVERVVANAAPLGGGTMQGAHGTLPLPAPATLELLRGWPVRPAPGPGEWVTPTGAALLRGLAEPGSMPTFRLQAIGCGAGRRDGGPVPNLLRALLGDDEGGVSAGSEAGEGDMVVLEAQVDDMPGEWLPPLFQALLEGGAVDVYATPMLQKKGRSGLLIGALALPAMALQVGETMLRHSTTLGVRRYPVERQVLERWSETVLTPFGPIRLKVARDPVGRLRASPEFEDCAAAARAHGVSVGEVYEAALMARSVRPVP